MASEIFFLRGGSLPIPEGGWGHTAPEITARQIARARVSGLLLLLATDLELAETPGCVKQTFSPRRAAKKKSALPATMARSALCCCYEKIRRPFNARPGR